MKLHQLNGRLSVGSRSSALLGAMLLLPFLVAAAPGDPPELDAAAVVETDFESPAEPFAQPLVKPLDEPLVEPLVKPLVEVIRGDFCGIDNPVAGVYLICCKPSSNVCIVTPEVKDEEGIFRVPDAAADSPARLFTASGYAVSRSPSRIAVRFTGVKSLAGPSPR